MRLKKTSIYSVLECLIAFLVILNGTTMWKYYSSGLVQTGRVGYDDLAILISMICFIYYLLDGKIRKKEVLLIAALLFYNLVYIVISKYDMMGFVLRIIIPLIGYLAFFISLHNRNRILSFFVRYSGVVLILAFISLALYILGEMLSLVPYQEIMLTRSGVSYSVKSYFNLLHIGQTCVFLGNVVSRNTGIFLEAPGWSMHLCLALCVELFAKREINKRSVLVLAATAITTFSTKALLIMPLCALVRLLTDKEKRGRLYRQLKTFIGPLLIIGLGFYVFYMLQIKSVDENVSFAYRIEDTAVAFKVIRNNVLLGCGFDNLEYFNSFLSLQKGSSVTAGVLKVIAQCGLFVSLEYFGGIILLFTTKRYSERAKYFSKNFVLMVVILLFVSSTWYNGMFLMTVAWGLSLFLVPKGGRITE